MSYPLYEEEKPLIYPAETAVLPPSMAFPEKASEFFHSASKLMFVLQGSAGVGLATLDLEKFFLPVLWFVIGAFLCVILIILLGIGYIPLIVHHCHIISYFFKGLFTKTLTSLIRIIFFIVLIVTIYTFICGIILTQNIIFHPQYIV